MILISHSNSSAPFRVMNHQITTEIFRSWMPNPVLARIALAFHGSYHGFMIFMVNWTDLGGIQRNTPWSIEFLDGKSLNPDNFCFFLTSPKRTKKRAKILRNFYVIFAQTERNLNAIWTLWSVIWTQSERNPNGLWIFTSIARIFTSPSKMCNSGKFLSPTIFVQFLKHHRSFLEIDMGCWAEIGKNLAQTEACNQPAFARCSILWRISNGFGKTLIHSLGACKLRLPLKYFRTATNLASSQVDHFIVSNAFWGDSCGSTTGIPSPVATSSGCNSRIFSANPSG